MNSGSYNYNLSLNDCQLRNPSVFLVDLQVRYDLGSALKLSQKIELIGMVVNALNNVDATSLFDGYSARNNRFGMVSSRSSPMQGQIIVRVRN